MESILLAWLSDVLGWSELASAHIPQWAVFGLSGLVAAGMGWWAMGREDLDRRYGLGMIAAAVVVGILFGHWVAVAFKPGRLLADPWRLVILFKGGISSFGVYGGAVLGAWMWAHFRRRPLWPTADALAPGLLIGAAIARTSCLLHGCDYGKVAVDLPWGIRYAEGTPAFAYLERLEMIDPYRAVGLPMHPFPLYELVPVLMVGLAATLWPAVLGRAPGQRAVGCAALYCGIRAVAEGFRGQSIALTGGITLLQVMSLAAALVFVGLWWHLGRRHRAALGQGDGHALG